MSAMTKHDEVKLFVDDLRTPPESGNWTTVRTITEAIAFLRRFNVGLVSLDHDIMHTIPQQITIPSGTVDDDTAQKAFEITPQLSDIPLACPETYMAVAYYIADMPASKRPHSIVIHTASTVGRQNLEDVLDKYEWESFKVGLYDKEQSVWKDA